MIIMNAINHFIKNFSLVLILWANLLFAQVGIGTTTPDASSALEIESTNSGILIPRMTEAQRTSITTPATGLLVYQSNNSVGFWYYNGSIWTKISDSATATGEFISSGGIVHNTTNLAGDDFVFGDAVLSGNASRFFFDISKAAFRAGQPSGNEWDNANVGDYSTALGYSTAASGSGSFATGIYAVASGDYSIGLTGGNATGAYSLAWTSTSNGDYSLAMLGATTDGEESIAMGESSSTGSGAENAVAIGYGNTANGSHSNAFGDGNQATGISSTALGSNTVSSGQGSLTAGAYALASGNYSMGLGGGNAVGDYSLAWNSTSNGDYSLAMLGGTSNGTYSVAMGNQVFAYSHNEFVIGYDSSTYTPSSTTTNVGTDRLFVVANNTTNNAFNILKNGRIGVGRIPSTNIFEVEGEASKSTAGDWLANSDARLKTNIHTFSEEEALSKLLSMRGVTYEWHDEVTGTKRPEGTQYGFIAQELMTVFPENVTKDNLGYYQTPYGTYDALYVQSIKALNSKIESLEAENKELKEQIQTIYSLLKNTKSTNNPEDFTAQLSSSSN